ncbi:MAG: histidinol-phosphate transaminase [Bacteroidales bacterium]|nr:histidinol-phosphate transaminase [Bacteroidales bacterium]
MKEIDALVRPNILALSPYSTARDDFKGKAEVYIDANESPFPSGWNRYPDPRQKALKARISALKGVPAESIFIGNGSDEAIDVLMRVFCTPGHDEVVSIAPSYGMYRVAADINDLPLTEVQLGEGFSLEPEKLLAACTERTKLLFLCSPNNPSGNAFAVSDLLRVAEAFRGITVVDEAYIDFSSQPSLLPQLAEHPRLVVLQTLSKARGMAALRLGLAFAAPRIVELMSRVKYPYNINEAAQKLALEVLENPIEGQVATVLEERARLERELPRFPFVRKIWPSDANFLLVQVDDADATYDHLTRDGIIVRNRNRVKGCQGCLRITVGLPEENDKLLKSLSKL